MNLFGTPLTNSGGSDIFLFGLTAAGDQTTPLLKQFGASASSNEHAAGLSRDRSGNLFLAGSIVEAVNFGGGALLGNGTQDAFAAKLTASGAHTWSKRYGGAGNDHADGIAVDALGNAIVTGDYDQSLDFGSALLLSPGGTSAFVAKFGP